MNGISGDNADLVAVGCVSITVRWRLAAPAASSITRQSRRTRVQLKEWRQGQPAELEEAAQPSPVGGVRWLAALLPERYLHRLEAAGRPALAWFLLQS